MGAFLTKFWITNLGLTPTIVQKVIPNKNYILRQLNTNKTQILHRIRLIKYVWNQPLEERYREAKLQLDSENIMTYTR